MYWIEKHPLCSYMSEVPFTVPLSQSLLVLKTLRTSTHPGNLIDRTWFGGMLCSGMVWYNFMNLKEPYRGTITSYEAI